jgi:predicted amidophosphoribosyltransferase
VLSRLENINISREPKDDKTLEDTKLSMENILSAPAYQFWQESAVEDISESDLKMEFSAISFTEPEPEPELEPREQTQAICAVCGNPLETDSDFCIICGTKIKNADSAKQTAARSVEDAFYGQKTDQTVVKTEFAPPTEPPVICAFCGETINPNDAFCIVCGTKVNKEASHETNEVADKLNSDEPAEPYRFDQNPLTASPTSKEDVYSATNRQADQIERASKPAQCPLCGEPIEGGNAFCIICGTPLQDAQSESDPFARPAPDETPRYSADRYSENETSATEDDPFANTSFALSKKSGESNPALEHTTISLQDILNNVRALEEKIITEAELADRNKASGTNDKVSK